MRDHYVPQFRLRHFANQNRTLSRLDKSTGEVRRNKSPKALACAEDFYTFTDEAGRPTSADPRLKRLEDDAAPALAQILKDERLGSLSPEQWECLLAYFSAEMLRTPSATRMLSDAALAMSASGHRLPPGSAADVLMATTDVESKAAVFGMISNGHDGVLNYLRDCWPTLVRAATGYQFVLGDNPVARETMESTDSEGPGRCLYVIPISSNLSLLLVPPGCGALDPRPSGTPFNARLDPPRTGSASLEVCEGWNFLQLKFAERHVFASGEACFESIRGRLVADPTLRVGLRPRVLSAE